MPITILLTFYINTLIAILILYVYILTTPIILAYTKTNLTLNSKLQKIILIISAAQILIVSIFIIKSIFEIGKNSRPDPTYSYQLKAEQITNIAENMYQSKKYNHLFKNNIIKLKDIENIESIKNPDRIYHYQFDYENSYIEIKENNQEIKSYIYLKSCTKKNKKCYILSSNSDDIFSQDIEYIEK